MGLRSTLLILLAIAASSQAANLHHLQFESRGLLGFPETDEDFGRTFDGLSLPARLRAVEDALETVVYEELGGLHSNYISFVTALRMDSQLFLGNFLAAIVPMIEACPAEVFKKAVIDAVKAGLSLMEDVETTVEKYNPLHPQVDRRSMIRRKLTTISTLGGSVGRLFEAVDALVVAAVEELVDEMKRKRKQIEEITLRELENIPAEILKKQAVIIIMGER